jgi:ATP-dependent Clp protease ATP-binding subunit ClpC
LEADEATKGGAEMFERFSGQARQVMALAEEEARSLDHNWLGTEHLMLGLIREVDGGAAKVLESLGVDLEAARQWVEEVIGRGEHAPSGDIQFTPRAKKVLDLASGEALGSDYIGTEHILLGLVREVDGVGAMVLSELGADQSRVRLRVTRLLREGWREPRS